MARRRIAGPIAGMVLGAQFAAKSLEPSLMRRSSIDQGLIMAGSFATGYVVGTTTARVVGVLPFLAGSGAVRVFGIAATFLPSHRPPATSEQPDGHSTDEATGWWELGGGVLSSVALASTVGMHPDSVIGPLAGIGIAAATVMDANEALAQRDDDVDAAYLATAVGAATGALTVVAAVAGGIRMSGRLAQKTTGRSGPAGMAIRAGAMVATTAAVGFGAKIAATRGIRAIAAGNRATESAYAQAPAAATVSGGDGSAVSFDSLGLQGRRLVLEATDADTIKAVMGEPQRQPPVRVYVGVESAPSVEERVELAITELEKTGGFERSRIVVASPAGTGYVNYIAIEACELFARGDVATVAIQYGSLPSMLSLDKVSEASSLYAALIGRLRSHIDDNDLEISLFAYGESLGALSGQNGILEVSKQGSGPIDGALWVGTPTGSALFEELTHERGVPIFDRPSQLTAYIDEGNTVPDATLLNHDNDPVTKFTLSSFYSMPDWLKASDRGRGVHPAQRWLPGIAFFQGLIDTKNAATVVPGEFGSTGHDYRADLAVFVMIAFGFSDVDDEQLKNTEAQLRTSEVQRSLNIAEGKL